MNLLNKFTAKEQELINRMVQAYHLFGTSLVDENPDFELLEEFSEEEHQVIQQFNNSILQ